jgi:hypothetical protein
MNLKNKYWINPAFNLFFTTLNILIEMFCMEVIALKSPGLRWKVFLFLYYDPSYNRNETMLHVKF